MKKRFSVPTLIVACLASIALAILCITSVFVFKFGGKDSFISAAKFAAISNSIENHYVGEADMEKVSDAAYSAMVEAIDDRWSYYMTAEQYEAYKQYQKNSYTGIGITIEADEGSGLYRVAVILEDSPAQRAGVKIGDLICAIDGKTLAGMTSSDIKKIIGEKKGEFELLLRADDGTERSVTVSTELVYSKPVLYEMLEDGIGYIKIKNFETNSGEDINAALDELVSNGAKGIVFDVRNNPGGLLSELLKALDHILPEGDIFVSLDKDGNENVRTSDTSCVKIPMTVLINENSYSAAEFFGAALSEYNWAALVGSHTSGKARSQINIELSDGSAVHISTNSYLTPNRVDLAKEGGLKPDIDVGLDDEAEIQLVAGLLEHAKDEQLISAIKTIKERVDK
ncbi:MAG: PDZ domain-containing protein [Clostridiales bacterium]|jgi:carboxyl-terminal processing protease|nr:PDZ domain-containing protein [Clostridiales bacterium]